MPYRKVKNADGTFRVTGPSGVHMKRGSEKDADAQIRLLHGVEHGMKPRKPARSPKGRASRRKSP